MFGRFWWDFIVGEDWRIAASIAVVLGIGLALAAWSGLSDAVLTVGVGVALHRPLARVPENTIKMAVGLLLSTVGTFWAVEGLGVVQEGSESLEWPGGDLALLAILVVWCAVAWLAVRWLRLPAPAGAGAAARPEEVPR
jgi:uncharacterized membrane protein